MDPSPRFHAVTRVISDAVDVCQRLFELGLTPEILTEAVGEGMAERVRTTAHHPRGAAGSVTYFYTVAALRDLLIPENWTIERPDNLETTVHPERLLAIAVSAGDHYTGNPFTTPSTKTEKGRATVNAVEGNQLRLWPVQDEWPSGTLPTYVLLHYFDEDTGEIRCELSLPSDLSGDMHIAEWRERIILPSGILGQMAVPTGVTYDSDDGDDGINVEVERRAG